MKQILLVEDEKQLARFIELELQHEGYAVTCANDGETGLQMAVTRKWDMILLDVMLPVINGMELCGRLQSLNPPPILMITARDAVSDRVLGLESGADDYISKPFAMAELLARMRAIFRRTEGSVDERFYYRDIEMDPSTMAVTVGDRDVRLTKREFDILKLFLEHPDEVITRDFILDKIWGPEAMVEPNIVDVYIRYLRSKISPRGEQSYIATVRGLGYKLQ